MHFNEVQLYIRSLYNTSLIVQVEEEARYNFITLIELNTMVEIISIFQNNNSVVCGIRFEGM